MRTEEIKPVSPADQEQVLGKAATNRKTEKEQENTEGRTSIPQRHRQLTISFGPAAPGEEQQQQHQHQEEEQQRQHQEQLQ